MRPEDRGAEDRTPLLANGFTGAEAGETWRGDGAGDPTDFRAKGLELDWRVGEAEDLGIVSEIRNKGKIPSGMILWRGALLPSSSLRCNDGIDVAKGVVRLE